MYPTSASFDAQQRSDSNIARARVWATFGDYGIGPDAAWSSDGSPVSDPSVYDSDFYDVADLGDGIRNHRNFGDAEGIGSGRGWQGGMRSDVATGSYAGVLIRNLETPYDGNKTNGPPPGGTGKLLGIRAQAPNPGGGVVTVKLQQIAVRIRPVGSPGVVLIRVYTDVGNAPAVLFLTFAVNPADSVDGWVYLDTIGPSSFTPGDFYWIVMDTQTGSAVNNWTWAYDNSSTVDEFASENAAGAWVAQTYRLHYRTSFSWAAGPTPGEYVTVTLTAARRLNRIRVYSYPSTRAVTGKGIATFQVQTGVAGVFTDAVISSAIGSDYGDGAAVVTVAGAQVATAGATFFDVSFDTVTADAVRLIVTKTVTPSDFARLLAVELFDRVEITDRVTNASSDIRRDQYMQLDQPRVLRMGCTNTDRFFSPYYQPTAAQVAAGYHNPELRADLPSYQPLMIEAEQGFLTNEFVPMGEFYVDNIAIGFKAKLCSITARDFNKFLMRNDLAENLRQFDRLEDLIELCANRANFSSSRMVLTTTETRAQYFMPVATKSRAEIDELCKAGVCGIVRFDESGVMRFLTFAPSSMSIGALPQATAAQTPYGTAFQALAGPLLSSLPAWSHVIMAGERAYISTLYTDAGFVSDFQTIVEYDVVGRTILRELKVETANQGLDPTIRQPFANLALDGMGSIFTTRKDRALKIDLTTLAVTTLDLTLVGLPGFTRTHPYCGIGAVVAGRYYFVIESNFVFIGACLASCDATTMAVASFQIHGVIQGSLARVQRMVHWNPPAGVDRIYFAFEPFAGAAAIVNTFYNIPFNAMGNDGIERSGVTTDGVLLYELLAAAGGVHTLQSRTNGGTLVTLGTQPANDDEGAAFLVARIGPCIGYAGHRVWSVYRTATQQILRLFNLADDVQFFDNELPEQLQASPISEDTATGRLILLGQNFPFGPFSGNPLIHALRLRMFECPHAPTASTFEADWDDQLLDGNLTTGDDPASGTPVLTRVTYIMHPLSISSPVVTWVGLLNGAIIDAINTFATGYVTVAGAFTGSVRFMPSRPSAGKPLIPFSTEFASYQAPLNVPGTVGPGVTVDADGVATFGPATGRSILPFPGAPQSVWWQTTTGSAPLSVTLTPHPSQPVLTIIPPVGGVASLTQLWIVASPFVRDTEVSVEATSEDVFADGAEIRKRNGDNAVEISNNYIGDVCMLRIAALELLRMFGRPQVQVSGVGIRWNPALGMEDIGTLKESETGIQAKLQVVGLQQSFAVSGQTLTVTTTPALVTLPVITTTGLGQGQVVPLGGPPVPV